MLVATVYVATYYNVATQGVRYYVANLCRLQWDYSRFEQGLHIFVIQE